MKSLLFLLLILIHFSALGQINEKYIQVTAPVGYRIYFCNEFQGVTNAENDGLYFKTNVEKGNLRIMKQNDIIYSGELQIDKNIFEFNLYEELIVRNDKSAYDYWQELFDALGDNSGSVKNYQKREMNLSMAQMMPEGKQYLAKVKSKDFSEMVEFDGVWSKWFYYGVVDEISNLVRKNKFTFILYFTYNKVDDVYVAILRYEAVDDAQKLVNGYSRDIAANETANRRKYDKHGFLATYTKLPEDFVFYPKLEHASFHFESRDLAGALNLDIFTIDDEMSFTWHFFNEKKGDKSLRNLMSDGTYEPPKNKIFHDVLYKKYW